MLSFDRSAVILETNVVSPSHLERAVEADSDALKADLMDETPVRGPTSNGHLGMDRVP